MVNSVSSPIIPTLTKGLRGQQGGSEGAAKTPAPGNGATPAATPESRGAEPAVTIQVTSSSSGGGGSLGGIDVGQLSEADIDNLIKDTSSQLAASNASIAGSRGTAELQGLFG